MAEFTSAEKVNIGYENEYSTDAMTGGPDKRRQLYYQLIPVSYTHLDVYKRQMQNCCNQQRYRL